MTDNFWTRIERIIGRARAVFELRHANCGRGVCTTGHVRIRNNGGTMSIGDKVMLLGGMVPTQLTCEAGGIIKIGQRSVFNYGASLHATQSVTIGERCMFASFVKIADADASSSPQVQAKPIVIEDDVWVAHGAVIFPGVTVGRGSVVSAGSVVKQDVPPNSLAIGNPARCMALDVVASA